MIADSGTASPPVVSNAWEGVLVGALDCAVDQHSLRVGRFKSLVPIVNHLQATLPDGAAWGSGSGAILAWHLCQLVHLAFILSSQAISLSQCCCR